MVTMMNLFYEVFLNFIYTEIQCNTQFVTLNVLTYTIFSLMSAGSLRIHIEIGTSPLISAVPLKETHCTKNEVFH